jgi:hypothetical protein
LKRVGNYSRKDDDLIARSIWLKDQYASDFLLDGMIEGRGVHLQDQPAFLADEGPGRAILAVAIFHFVLLCLDGRCGGYSRQGLWTADLDQVFLGPDVAEPQSPDQLA